MLKIVKERYLFFSVPYTEKGKEIEAPSPHNVNRKRLGLIDILNSAMVSMLPKLYMILNTYGMNDEYFWEEFVRTIANIDIIEIYHRIDYYNHTPLISMILEARTKQDCLSLFSSEFLWLFAISPLSFSSMIFSRIDFEDKISLIHGNTI